MFIATGEVYINGEKISPFNFDELFEERPKQEFIQHQKPIKRTGSFYPAGEKEINPISRR